MGRPIAIATLICGSLDILFAMILTVTRGGEIGNMLRSVASGRRIAEGGAKPDALPPGACRNSRGIQDSILDRD